MIKTCEVCGQSFDGYFSSKFCPTCQPKAKRKRQREAARRYYQINREHKREYMRKYCEEQKRKLIREILSATGVKPK